jgi:Suppressor of forked protein (Suf)
MTAIRSLSKRMGDLYPEGKINFVCVAQIESNLNRFITRHSTLGMNPIAIYDLPPPLSPIKSQPSEAIHIENGSSVPSSRANSVQPPDVDEARRAPLDRIRQERMNSPDPRVGKKMAATKLELPSVLMEFLAALPPARMFDTATFHIDELVKLIRSVNVPLPQGSVLHSKRNRGSEEDGDYVRVKKNRGK